MFNVHHLKCVRPCTAFKASMLGHRSVVKSVKVTLGNDGTTGQACTNFQVITGAGQKSAVQKCFQCDACDVNQSNTQTASGTTNTQTNTQTGISGTASGGAGTGNSNGDDSSNDKSNTCSQAPCETSTTIVS